MASPSASAPLPLVAPCSRRIFSARSQMRVLDHAHPYRFIPYHQITRDKVAECPHLTLIRDCDPISYLSEYMGIPGLVKGVIGYGSGMLVFSENMKHMTVVCSSRVSGNRIKFNHGSEEFKEDRANCWEFCCKRERIDIIVKQFRSNPQTFPLHILRPTETTCPICYDDLTDKNIYCDNRHQICLSCFDLLPGFRGLKKCPCCNSQTYKDDQLDRYDLMKGKLTKEDPYFYLDLPSYSNSFYDFAFKEAQFLGMLKAMCRHHKLSIYEQMLASALYNFYTLHQDHFSLYTFNILDQVDYNNRQLNPFSDDTTSVIDLFIEVVRLSQVSDDVAYTSIYTSGYDDIDFYRDLEYVEGNIERVKDYPNQSKDILKREIFFRAKVKRSTDAQIREHIMNIFRVIATNAHSFNNHFRIVEQNVNMT